MSEREFVPASRLYDLESRTPIAHPAHQATDADVRKALKQREIRADGGRSSSVTYRVTCRDCDLEEEYQQAGIAVGRKLVHHDVRGHRAGYEEVRR